MSFARPIEKDEYIEWYTEPGRAARCIKRNKNGRKNDRTLVQKARGDPVLSQFILLPPVTESKSSIYVDSYSCRVCISANLPHWRGGSRVPETNAPYGW